MCGISGIFSHMPINSSAIVKSLYSIKHRGPDDTLISASVNDKHEFFSCNLSSEDAKHQYSNVENINSNQWLGYNRLAIIDQSFKGMQPFYDAASNTSFLLNGEIYNYISLKKSLLRDENMFSSSDSEVAFKLYLKYGDDFIGYLRGMFAIVIVVHTLNVVKIWRDRFGIKPMYYICQKDYFLFSSEIGGLTSTGLNKAEIDFQSLAHQFYLSTSASPETIYKNINSLQPGGFLQFNLSDFSYTVNRYWSLKYSPSTSNAEPEELLEDIAEVCSLNLTGVESVPKGLMLSGGIDSGTLSFFLGNQCNSIRAYTIFDDSPKSLTELKFARLNAVNGGLNLEELKIPENVDEDLIEDFCMAEEEPNICPEPAYFLSSNVKNKERILFNALGLDEIFYGYDYHLKYRKYLNIGFASSFVKKIVSKEIVKKIDEFKIFGVSGLPFIMRAPALWNDIKNLFKDYYTKSWEHPVSKILREVDETSIGLDRMDNLKRMSFLDLFYYISSHHSLRSDRPAMLNHIEMRFPFLDHLFVQKYFNQVHLGTGLSFNNNKPFLRSSVSSVLDKRIFEMPKRGFSMPVNSWCEDINWSFVFNKMSALFVENDLKLYANSYQTKWQLLSLCKIYEHLKAQIVC